MAHDTLSEHFWARVQKTDSCWLWTKTIDKKGYGEVHHTKRTFAHRVSWMLHFGEIPKGLFVCHHCDVRNCVRPDHLFIGTNYMNVQDRERKGRGRYVVPIRQGEAHCCAKLTNEIVLQIRADGRFKTKEFRREMAAKFGVSSGHILNVMHGRTWRHLLPPSPRPQEAE